jgi:hypothetical protein
MCALVALTGTGCKSSQSTTAAPEIPTYATLVTKYNKKINGLDRVWSRAVVEVTWKDGDADRFEQGEGLFIVEQPSNTALTVGKLGNIVLWAGSNTDSSWLLDLKEGDSTAYTIHNANIGNAAAKPLPVAVKPNDMIKLVGITKLDPNNPPSDPQVEWVDDDNAKGFLIEPPGTNTRILIDPVTYLATRVEVLDANGHAVIDSHLSKPESVDQKGSFFGGGATMNSRIEIFVPTKKDKVVLYLSDLSSGADEKRITDDLFSPSDILGTYKPSKTVELDKDVPAPASAPATDSAPAAAPAAAPAEPAK